METINLPPYAPSLMESTRAIGYSIEAAIADIIDNSITAKGTKIDIDFFPIGEAYISILDNGEGMSADETTHAMQYGSKNPNEIRERSDLGRYGLGLKTASLSQCRQLSVISKKNGILSGRQWDLDFIIASGEWSLKILDNEEMDKLPCINKLCKMKSGTLIVWQNLDKFSVGESNIETVFQRKIETVREHLSLVFHRYLCGEPSLKKIEICINSRPIEYTDPFLKGKSTQLMDDEVFIIRGQQVVIKPYILPHISKLSEKELKQLGGKDGLRRQQGFYVYRNKRLLIWATWFRLIRQGDLSKLARVQVDIPNSLDDLWTLDIKKSTAIPPEEVRTNLANVINKIADGSKRTWTYRGKKEVDDSRIHLWNRIKTRDNGIVYEINRDYPIIINMIKKTPSIKKTLDTLITQIELTLPLNSLFVDLTNDEKIGNEVIYDEYKILQLLKNILDTFSVSTNKKKILCDNLKITEPFCDYTEAIDQAIRDGKLI